MGEFCAEGRLRLAADRLVYLSHWLTQLGRAKRFDARFFIAEAPAGQTVAHSGVDTVAHQWLRPSAALARADALKVMTPTRATLQSIAHFANVAALMAWARAPREVPRIFPRIGVGAQGARPVTPHEYTWAEIGRLALHPQRQDGSFAPDYVLNIGERIVLNEDTTLRVIHTPGHGSNHLCYLLDEEQPLFTGDDVMQSATVVINPPDGDMAAYIASLRALSLELNDALTWLAPGHGFLMEKPRRAFVRRGLLEQNAGAVPPADNDPRWEEIAQPLLQSEFDPRLTWCPAPAGAGWVPLRLRRAAARVFGAAPIEAGHGTPVRGPSGKFSGVRPCKTRGAKRAVDRGAAPADTWSRAIEIATLAQQSGHVMHST